MPINHGPFQYVGLKTAPSNDEVGRICSHPSLDVVAVDIPFGWPTAFRKFVSGWRLAGPIRPPEPDRFRYRLTDLVVRDEAPKNPMSVAADRIAMGTREWLSVVSRYQLERRIDVTGANEGESPAIIEVYPGATLVSALGWKEGYKQEPARRRKVLDQVVSKFGLTLTAAQAKALVGSGKDSDNLDALLAAVTAGVYVQALDESSESHGLAIRKPRGEEIREARGEGWIFFPVPTE
jgi:hypothetical protein